jgi:hypothetical protein
MRGDEAHHPAHVHCLERQRADLLHRGHGQAVDRLEATVRQALQPLNGAQPRRDRLEHRAACFGGQVDDAADGGAC